MMAICVVALLILSMLPTHPGSLQAQAPAMLAGIKPPGPPKEFSDDIREALLQFRTVEVRLVEGMLEQSLDYEGYVRHAYGGYPPRSDSKTLEPSRIPELVRLLTVDAPDVHKACIFHPNICYRFLGEQTTFRILVCHGCAQATFQWNDRYSSWEIDESNIDLIRFGLTLFSEDEVLKDRLEKEINQLERQKSR